MVSVISCDLVEEPRQKYFCRSTMAHEIGHAILHVSDYKRAKAILKSIHNKDHILRMYYEKELKPYMNPEWQAWRFAGALLMPAPAIKEATMEGNGIYNMSQRFGVNSAFVKSRLKTLTKILPINKGASGNAPLL
ncbi:MAG: ImmA/IrrE family metallo-endopeptidase [Candidatus Brocadia sp.]|nr:ImmA/IrrE family metallo-endopeptidase [Candidatus Brocadia sp.]